MIRNIQFKNNQDEQYWLVKKFKTSLACVWIYVQQSAND